jgi:hypothetical protein
MSAHINLSGDVPRDVATEAFTYAVRSLRATGATISGSVGGYSDGADWSVNASDVTDADDTDTTDDGSAAPPEDTTDIVESDDEAESPDEATGDASAEGIVATEPVAYDAADPSNTGGDTEAPSGVEP